MPQCAAAVRLLASVLLVPSASGHGHPAAESPTGSGTLLVRPESLLLKKGQYVQVNKDPIPPDGPGTVCFWMELKEFERGTNSYLVSAGAQTSGSFGHASLMTPSFIQVRVNYPNFKGTAIGGHEIKLKNNPVPKDSWTHICYAFDPDKNFLRLYINGTLVEENLEGGSMGAKDVKLTPGLTINTPNNAPGKYSGEVRYARVSLWKTALDKGQISQVYGMRNISTLSFFGSCVASWKLDGWLHDTSSGGHDLVAAGDLESAKATLSDLDGPPSVRKYSVTLEKGDYLKSEEDPIPSGGAGTVCFEMNWKDLEMEGEVDEQDSFLISTGAQTTASYGHGVWMTSQFFKVMATYKNFTGGGAGGYDIRFRRNPVPKGAWTYICYAFDPDKNFLRLYFNGTLYAEVRHGQTWGGEVAKLKPGLTINTPNHDLGKHSGRVEYSTVSFWKRALDAEQVNTTYEKLFNLSDVSFFDSCVGWWKMDGSFADLSGQGHTLQAVRNGAKAPLVPVWGPQKPPFIKGLQSGSRRLTAAPPGDAPNLDDEPPFETATASVALPTAQMEARPTIPAAKKCTSVPREVFDAMDVQPSSCEAP